ncbi:cytochrome P450 [Lentinula raphanica]|uniref:Cytochrome P450 n=1 Tax=Lentinula raphanica TaxID=153919 RepID=A0AA38UFL7_9AGAR|nr:cytochrome P450 [Lentinula raphanica]KAJ3840012.1 cytochrome P450 [Lentinula raphanica]KAJ3975830.1 cytochrome P450 [Lentinula raphanica]
MINIHVIALLFLVFLWICQKVQRLRMDIQKLSVVPMRRSWIWGHEFELFKRQACEMHIKWATSMGSMYRVKAALFQPDIIVINDVAAMQYIFQNAYTYVKAPAFRPIIKRLIGNGIVYAEGEEHKHQRKLLAPAFTSNAVKAMSDDIFACADKMIHKLRAELNSSTSGTNVVVDVAPMFSTCTLDIIGRVAFGHDFGSGDSTEAKEISSAWHEDVLMAHTFVGFLAPRLINLFPWITSLPIPVLPAESVSKRIVDRLAGKLLKDVHLQALNLDSTDILSLLVRDSKIKGKSEIRLSDDELLDNITTFMMVGHETSSASLIFTLLELARNPSVQHKLRQEITAAGQLHYDSVQQLEYLDCVVKEGLRLHPALPLTERVALQDDVIPLMQPLEIKTGRRLTSVSIKAGQVFHIPLTALNVSLQIWGDNAAQFMPERWLEREDLSVHRLPHGPWAEISTFSDGPRSCIGYRLAVSELKIITAVLVRSFEFEDTGAKIEEYMLPTLQSFADGKAASLPLKVSLVSDHGCLPAVVQN